MHTYCLAFKVVQLVFSNVECYDVHLALLLLLQYLKYTLALIPLMLLALLLLLVLSLTLFPVLLLVLLMLLSQSLIPTIALLLLPLPLPLLHCYCYTTITDVKPRHIQREAALPVAAASTAAVADLAGKHVQ